MSYLERSREIQEKLSTHAAGISECALELSELVCDMAGKIESLEDELRNFREAWHLKKAYGD